MSEAIKCIHSRDISYYYREIVCEGDIDWHARFRGMISYLLSFLELLFCS